MDTIIPETAAPGLPRKASETDRASARNQDYWTPPYLEQPRTGKYEEAVRKRRKFYEAVIVTPLSEEMIADPQRPARPALRGYIAAFMSVATQSCMHRHGRHSPNRGVHHLVDSRRNQVGYNEGLDNWMAPPTPTCQHTAEGKSFGAIGSEWRRIPSPLRQGQRSSWVEVRWPESQLATFPGDAPCLHLVGADFLEGFAATSPKRKVPSQDPGPPKGHKIGNMGS